MDLLCLLWVGILSQQTSTKTYYCELMCYSRFYYLFIIQCLLLDHLTEDTVDSKKPVSLKIEQTNKRKQLF